MICILATQISEAQINDSLSLSYCLDQTIANFPLIKQKDIYPVMSNLRIENLSKNYLPQMSANGSATYQSDVTTIPVNMPGMPEIYKDNYKVTLDINQMVYDGGITKSQKKIEDASLKIDNQKVMVDLYNLKSIVIQLYFNVLLMQEYEKQYNLVIDELTEKLKTVESAVRNGAQMQTNADLIRIEILKAKQLIEDIINTKNANIAMVGLYMNKSLKPGSTFGAPQNLSDPTDTTCIREELKLFDYQKNRLDEMKKLSSGRLTPRVSVFGQAGYGRPGLDMFSTTFDPYYMVGARLNWNFWNWNQTKNEIKIIEYQKNMVNNQREVFDQTLKVSLEKELADIEKYHDLINQDMEIVKLRENIIKAYSSQLDNGVITSTDYIIHFNNKNQSVLLFETHKLMLTRSIVNYLYLLGKF
jgi:outer membrane protein TolC